MADSASTENASKVREAEIKYEEGRTALRQDDYDKAIELLGSALELRVQVYGELAPECASAYFKYGTALLYKAQAETDAFGAAAASAGRKAGAAGNVPEEDEVEEEGDEEPQEKDEGEGEELEDEEEGDLELAWKLLETAKLIHERQPGHSVEEADIIASLADVSLEKEDFSTSLEDYGKALAILEELLEPDNRMLAELCFKISLAHQLTQQPGEALTFCRRAMAVCESRIKRLRGGTEPRFHGTESNEMSKGKEKVDEVIVENLNRTESYAKLLNGTDGKSLNGSESNGKSLNGVEFDENSTNKAAIERTLEVEIGQQGGSNSRLDSQAENLENVNGGPEGGKDLAGNEGSLEKKEASRKVGIVAEEKEIKDLEALLVDLKEKEEDLLLQASAPSLEEALRAEHPEAFQTVRALFRSIAAPAGAPSGAHGAPPAGGKLGAPGREAAAGGQTELTTDEKATAVSAGFDAPQLAAWGGSGSVPAVMNLGVVGRGIKRATPVSLAGANGANGNHSAEQQTKRRNLDELMKGDAEGESSFGF